MTLSINAAFSGLKNNASQLRNEVDLAMTRLSTGKKLNHSGDSPVATGRVANIRSQVVGLAASIASVGNASSMLETADAGLDEILTTLQTIKSLALNATSSLTSNSSRITANSEASQLSAEIARISTSTLYNGADLLDGTFSSQTLQIGPTSSETMSVTIASVNTSGLGSFVINGTTRDALAAATSASANSTTTSEDITITVNSVATAIAATANESAKDTAVKINAVASDTGVTAKARTYALLASSSESSANYSVKINDTATSTFAISSTSVSAAVTAINAITATTGVTASATSDFKVLLNDDAGADITIENESSGSNLTVQAVKYDGVTTQGSAVSLQANDSNDATRVIGTLRLISDAAFSITQAGTAAQAYLSTASAAQSNLTSLDLTTVNKAIDSLELVESAINQVTTERSSVGGALSRLESSVDFLTRMKEQKSLNVSYLQDADISLESARLAKATMLQRANAALLAQANSDKDLILSIIRSSTPALRY